MSNPRATAAAPLSGQDSWRLRPRRASSSSLAIGKAVYRARRARDRRPRVTARAASAASCSNAGERVPCASARQWLPAERMQIARVTVEDLG